MRTLVHGVDLVVASPGVPPSHPVFSAANRENIVSEIELASWMIRPPIVAVTGTNGKTTVVELVSAMLRASGRRSEATGNIGVPLISVVGRDDLDVVVAEVSSFQLARSPTFRPAVGTWLNFAPNHLDWHASTGEYFAAKAGIWAHQREGDVAIANADDETIAATAARAAGRVVTFGAAKGDYRLDGDEMIAADGTVLARSSDLVRDLPHDRLNALAALVTALESGATRDGVLEALRTTSPPAHRLERVATVSQVAYYDDSKATTPAAVATAMKAFPAVVLILGGKNKGLDLSVIKAATRESGSAIAARRCRDRRVRCGDRADLFPRLSRAPRRVDGRRGRRRRITRAPWRRGAALTGLRLVRLVRVVRSAWRRLQRRRASAR